MRTLYVDVNELADLLGVSVKQSRAIIKETNEELEQQGVRILKTKPMKTLKSEVVRRLGLERSLDETRETGQ